MRALTIADRATLGNMCPEYGATVAIFPIDEMTLDYLRLTGRDESRVQLVEDYAKAQGLFRTDGSAGRRSTPRRSSSISSTIEPSLAGPKRPQDRVSLEAGEGGVPDGAADDAGAVEAAQGRERCRGRRAPGRGRRAPAPMAQSGVAVADPALDELDHGAVVIAAITSCTNTSNPSVMIGAGLLAKKAVEKGLHAQAVGEEQPRARLEGRHRVPRRGRPDAVSRRSSASTWSATAARPASATAVRCPTRSRRSIREKNLVVCSVLSGNRNFEGRIQQDVRANYLASPPLVVAYALAGWITKDLTTEPLGEDHGGQSGVPEGHLADASRSCRRRCCAR